jgi:hypothetical protein
MWFKKRRLLKPVFYCVESLYLCDMGVLCCFLFRRVLSFHRSFAQMKHVRLGIDLAVCIIIGLVGIKRFYWNHFLVWLWTVLVHKIFSVRKLNTVVSRADNVQNWIKACSWRKWFNIKTWSNNLTRDWHSKQFMTSLPLLCTVNTTVEELL